MSKKRMMKYRKCRKSVQDRNIWRRRIEEAKAQVWL
jgi:hypothetical protein